MNEKSTTKRLAGMIICAAWVLGANTALAGEITGNGKWIAGSPEAPLNGKSECAFSGQQDDPGEPPFRGLIAQSWGQIPKAIRDILTAAGLNPGISCNPTKASPPPL
jgi:hypothetical protein